MKFIWSTFTYLDQFISHCPHGWDHDDDDHQHHCQFIITFQTCVIWVWRVPDRESTVNGVFVVFLWLPTISVGFTFTCSWLFYCCISAILRVTLTKWYLAYVVLTHLWYACWSVSKPVIPLPLLPRDLARRVNVSFISFIHIWAVLSNKITCNTHYTLLQKIYYPMKTCLYVAQ